MSPLPGCVSTLSIGKDFIPKLASNDKTQMAKQNIHIFRKPESRAFMLKERMSCIDLSRITPEKALFVALFAASANTVVCFGKELLDVSLENIAPPMEMPRAYIS